MPTASPTAEFDVNLSYYREITVYGAFFSQRQWSMATDAFITHRLKLDEILRAIEMKWIVASIEAAVLA